MRDRRNKKGYRWNPEVLIESALSSSRDPVLVTLLLTV